MEEDNRYSETVAAQFLDQGGLWQWRQLILILLAFLSSAMQSFSIIFIGFQPKFDCGGLYKKSHGWNMTEYDLNVFDDRCTIGDNSSEIEPCETEFYYSINKEESIVSEVNQWDLICDKAYLSEVSQLMYTVGMGIGALAIGPASDRLGRKKSFLTARVLSLCCSTGVVLSPRIEVFMGLRFLTGILEMSCSLVRSVYITELTPIKYRPLTTSLAGIMWALALCVEALIGHLLRGWNWRIFQAIITVFTLPVFLEMIYVKESLSWLFANGKAKEATVLLKAAFKTNGITIADVGLSEEHVQPLTTVTPDKSYELDRGHAVQNDENIRIGTSIESIAISFKETKITLIGMMKNRTSRRLIMVICFVWFVNSLVYYGLFLMSPAMVGDRVLNFFIIAVVEIPACCGLFVILRYFGRKKAMIGYHAVCAICLLLAGVFNLTMDGGTKDLCIQIVTFIGKFGIAASYLMLYFYTAETLPTNFRTSGVGIASFSARCGSCLSPFSSVLLRLLPWGPGIIFGCLCFVVSGLLFLVPETGHHKLPQTISEIESWKKCEK